MRDTSASVRIPHAPEEITGAWLQDVVPGLRVDTVEIEQVGAGIGVMSVLYRVRPTYSAGGEGPESFVVKLAPALPAVREIAAGYGFYHREVEVYGQLGLELGFRPATIYLALHDPTDDSFVVVMEDLSGLRTVDQIIGCPPDDAADVVDELARHHARWWENARLDRLPFIQEWHRPPYPAYSGQAGAQAWPIFAERFGHLIPARVAAIAERWVEVGPPLMEDHVNHPRTMCHGDLRLDNMFFHADGGAPVTMVDWQIASRAPGTFDFAYFMSQSLAADVRGACQQELCRRYHEGLLAGGVTDYPFDEFWADYRRSTLFCLGYPLQGGAVELVNDRAVALIEAITERAAAAIVDVDADQFAA